MKKGLRCSCKIAAALLTYALVATSVEAQQDKALPPTVESLSAELKSARQRQADLEKIIFQLNSNIDALKSPDDAAYRKAVIDHNIATLKQIQAVYDWQVIASDVLLCLVGVIVAAGLLFAGFQLWQAVKLGQPQTQSDLEVSASNFRLTTSTVGIVILALSFFFFYLFVKDIYAIAPPAQPVTAPAKG
jgi:hypothetical protein